MKCLLKNVWAAEQTGGVQHVNGQSVLLLPFPGAPATGGSHFYNRKICSMKWKIFLLKYFPLHNPNIKLYGIHEKVAGKCYTLILLKDTVTACRQCQ